jgi:hypothetical protein
LLGTHPSLPCVPRAADGPLARPQPQTLLGKPADSFSPLTWTQQDFIEYARNDALKPGLPIVVLFALCLLTLVVLMLW